MSGMLASLFAFFGALPRRALKILQQFREERAFARTHPSFHHPLPADPTKTVLIVNLNEWVPRAMLDGVLARGMLLRGYTPVVLTRKHCRWSRRRLRNFGVERFVEFDGYLAEAQRDISLVDVRAMTPTPVAFDALYGFVKDGIGIGRHVLSTVVRSLVAGSVAFDDPKVRQLLDSLLPRSFHAAAAARAVMEAVKPATVLFLEKGYTPYGELFDAAIAYGADTIQYCHAHSNDLLLMKRYSDANRFQHPYSLSARSWEAVRRHPWDAGQEKAFMDDLKKSYEEGRWFNRKFLLKGKKTKTPAEVRTQLGLDPGKKTAVIFSHVLWDATFFFGKNLFPDYETWLVETVKVACKNTAVNWVIKLHPDYVWKMQIMGPNASPRDLIVLRESIGELPQHIRVVLPDTDISTYSFFSVTDYCITVRGTIGIEAPCFGIPVFTAGTGRYSGLGFTNDSATADDYRAKLARLQDFPPLTAEQTTLGRKHAWGLFHGRPLRFTTCEIVAQTAEKGLPDYHAVLRASTTEDLVRAQDLRAFLDWVLDSQDEDYLSL